MDDRRKQIQGDKEAVFRLLVTLYRWLHYGKKCRREKRGARETNENIVLKIAWTFTEYRIYGVKRREENGTCIRSKGEEKK